MPSGMKVNRHHDIQKTAQWKAKDMLSNKQGPHATVYFTNGDRYIGSWKDNQRHGKGIHYYKNSGNQYEGEFENDMRHGYGVLSIPIQKPGPDSKLDSLFEKTKAASPIPQLRKLYAGSWSNDKRHGQGTCFYNDSSVYNGLWANDMREGWGKMSYDDGSAYEGEFHKEKRHGQGIHLLASGDRYEGMWFNDVKEGPGKYIYLKKRRYLEGEWSKGLPRCGILKDLSSINGKELAHPLPPIGIQDIESILEGQRELIYEERAAELIKLN